MNVFNFHSYVYFLNKGFSYYSRSVYFSGAEQNNGV